MPQSAHRRSVGRLILYDFHLIAESHSIKAILMLRKPIHHRFGVTQIELLVTMTAMTCLLALLFPAVQGAREAARRAICSNHIRQVNLGILEFESAHRQLPSNDGLTWTQRIAFQTGEVERVSADLASLSPGDQEWLLNHLPKVFACPSAQQKSVANYPSAHFGMNMRLIGRRLRDIIDGNSNTLLTGELKPFLSAPWVLGPTVNEIQFGSDHEEGSHVALADGSVRFFSSTGTASELEALLTPAGGEL